MGQDTRAGAGNAAIGGDDPADVENHQADTAMIAHISANRDRVELVSLPRDSIVQQPECATTKGIAPARSDVMLNSTFAYGWSQGGDLASAVSCELATVNQATGLEITQSVVVDFAGLAKMIDAIGGVDICVPSRVDDPNTNLNLEPGYTHMDGVTATQYARVRHGVEGADGSDVMRTARQQSVIKALIKEALGDGLLSNPSRLYALGVTALDSMNMSTGLASAPTLAGLAYSLRNLELGNVQSITVPTLPWSQDANRVVWTGSADAIWGSLKMDRPINDASGDDSAHAEAPAVDATHDAEEDSSSADGDGGGVNDTQILPFENTGQSGEGTGNDGLDPPYGYMYDPATRLFVSESDPSIMIDPVTRGTVDAYGYIHDPQTNSIIGAADSYIGTVICKAS